MVQITSAVVAFLRERMRFWKEGGLKGKHIENVKFQISKSSIFSTTTFTYKYDWCMGKAARSFGKICEIVGRDIRIVNKNTFLENQN